MQLIKNTNIELDVYSSTKVYGDDFEKENDHIYQPLYDQAKLLSNVNYIGYKSNQYILENLHTYDAFIYPNVWEETFCISALESLACGLFVATTDNGALYETCSEFPVYIPMDTDYTNLAKQFAAVIDGIPEQINSEGCHAHLKFQQNFFNHFYNWKTIAGHWTGFLKGALHARSIEKKI
jgi:glycosyltransferase involved in cell wall biosynthesis